MVDLARARGAAVVDLDLDGRLDLVSVVRREPVRVWQNGGLADGGQAGHWLGIDLEQPGPNRDAIGAWLAVRVGDRVLRARADRRGRARQRDARADPRRARAGDHGRGPGDLAGRDGGPWRPIEADRYVTIRRDAPGGGDVAALTARLAPVDAARLRPSGRHAGGPRLALPRAPGRPARADGRPRVRPGRGLRRPRAQRQPVVADRLRPALRGGGPRRRPGRRAGDPRRQRVRRGGARGAAADAGRPAPGPQPAVPAARSVPTVARGARRRGGRRRSADRDRRLEDVRRPIRARRAELPGRHGPGPGRGRRVGRERDGPVHRPGRRPAGRSTTSTRSRRWRRRPARRRPASCG